MCVCAYASISDALIFKLNIAKVCWFYFFRFLHELLMTKIAVAHFVVVDSATEHVVTVVYVNNYNCATNAFNINSDLPNRHAPSLHINK